jgi:hypothetical protein
MKGYITIAACIWCGAFVTTEAIAQVPSQCPTGINPLQLLVGTWTFSTEGISLTSTPFGLAGPQTSAGQFVGSISPAGAGVLSITNTTSRNGQITRLETDAGRYQVFPDCSGATLTFNLSTGPVSFDVFIRTRGSSCCQVTDIVCWDELLGSVNLPGQTGIINIKRLCPPPLPPVCQCPAAGTIPATAFTPTCTVPGSRPFCNPCTAGCGTVPVPTIASGGCCVPGTPGCPALP